MLHLFSAGALCVLGSFQVHASVPPPNALRTKPIKIKLAPSTDAPIIFDLPIAYNPRVQQWIKYFQGPGRGTFTTWLERSNRYLPSLKRTLKREGLPQDLAYVVMIESGFSHSAVSHAQAVGPWQFISETGQRYGLMQNWWLDERRDFEKSTLAAAKYFRDLYNLFGSWYLAAAGYNTGEARVKRLIEKHQTRNFWAIAHKGGFAEETRNYVPKLIAAMLIAKAPAIYGFRNLKLAEPFDYEHFFVPGGTDLRSVAQRMGVDAKVLRELNPELIRGFVPVSVSNHRIRIPRGKAQLLSALIYEDLTKENESSSMRGTYDEERREGVL